MGNYFISLPDMVIVIAALSPPLTIVIPSGHRIQFVVCARFRKRGSDQGYEDVIKYAINELKTNHGGIVTASERVQPECAPWYTLLLSKKNYETAANTLFCLRPGLLRDVAVGRVCELQTGTCHTHKAQLSSLK